MVVQKARQRMKESSVAERVIAGLLAAFLGGLLTIGGMIYHLNREVGESIVLWRSHLDNHPNLAIEEDVRDHEQRLRDIERSR